MAVIKKIIFSDNSNRVGIGTTTPNATLDVSGSAIISGSLDVLGNSYIGANAKRVYIYDDGNAHIHSTSGPLWLNAQDGTSDIRINNQYNGNVILTNGVGNVGVGTSSPTSKFTIQGSQSEMHVKHDSTVALAIGNWDGAAQYIKSINLGVALTPLVLQASRFTLDTGNVGIGESSPSQKLHVSGSIRVNGGIYDSSNSIGTNGQVLTSTGTGLAWSSAGSGTISGGGAANYVARFSTSTNITTGSIYDSGSYVGIGTIVPSALYRLTIDGVGSSGQPLGGINFRQGGSDTFYLGNPSTNNSTDVELWNSRNGYLRFATNNSERMRILADGNVGIGTTTPYGDLEVKAKSKSWGEGIIVDPVSDATNNYSAIFFRKYGAEGSTYTGTWALGKNASGTNGGEVLQVVMEGLTGGALYRADASQQWKTNGDSIFGFNVGIGTTSPKTVLDVYNNIDIWHFMVGGATSKLMVAGQSPLGVILQGATGSAANNATVTSPYNIILQRDGGNVGIGSASPTALLDVHKPFTSSGLYEAKAIALTTDNGPSNWTLGQIVGYVAAGTSNGTTGFPGGLMFKTKAADSNAGESGVATRMVINASGSVGIGTTNPSYKVQIDSAAEEFQIAWTRTSSKTWAIGTDSGGTYFNNRTDNLLPIYIKNDGNVGIGTTSPSAKLHTLNTTDAAGPLFENNAGRASITIKASSTNSSYVQFGNANGNGQAFIDFRESTGYFGMYTSFSGGYITFNTDQQVERVRITSVGNVGIGTTSPQYKLDISGSLRTGDTTLYSSAGTNPKLYFSSSVGSSSIKLEVLPDGGLSFIGSNGQLFGITDNLSGSLMNVSDISGLPILEVFSDDKVVMGKFGTNALVVTGSCVGIGTNAPSYKLHIGNNTATASAHMILDGVFGNTSVASHARIYFSDTNFGIGAGGWSASSGDDDLYLWTYDGAGRDIRFAKTSDGTSAVNTANWTTNMIIKNDGNVGIGTSSPLYRLQLGTTTASSTSSPETINLGGTYSNSAGANVKIRVYDDGAGSVAGMNVSLNQMELNTWSSGKIAFYRGTTQTMVIDSNGNVGIGTSSPLTMLHVNNGSNGDITAGFMMNMSSTNQGASALGMVGINVSGGAGNSVYGLRNGYNPQFILFDWTSAMQFHTTTTLATASAAITGTEKMRITNTGNVGIGTTNPTERLYVSGGGVYIAGNTSDGANLRVGGVRGTFTNEYIHLYNKVGIGDPTGWGGGESITPTYGLSVYGGAVLATNSGNVGIGKTTANTKLDVNGNTYVSGSARITGALGIGTNVVNWPLTVAAPGQTGMAIVTTDLSLGSSGTIFYFGLGASTGTTYGTLEVTDALVPANRQNIIIQSTSNARVGIGTTTPNAKLDVNGNTIISGSLTVTQPVTASVLSATSITVTNLNVTTISSSVVYSSGSNTFGNTTSNKQQFTGSVQINGTLTTNDATETTDVFGLKTFTKSLTVTTSWLDTGISGTDLATGTYILQVLVDNYDVSGAQYTEYYSGVMSWFSTGTNSTDYDEIVLHKAGHAPSGNWINLRTLRQTGSNPLKLQIIANVNTSGADNYIFKFRRMI